MRSSEFEAFLRLVDGELSQDCTIVVVGGAAIGLAYAPAHSTTDIDVMPRAPVHASRNSRDSGNCGVLGTDRERRHIFPFPGEADAVFDSSLVYEPAVLKVCAERYLLEVPSDHPASGTALRLRTLIDRFVAIYPDHVPPTSIIREFIAGSGFEY